VKLQVRLLETAAIFAGVAWSVWTQAALTELAAAPRFFLVLAALILPSAVLAILGERPVYRRRIDLLALSPILCGFAGAELARAGVLSHLSGLVFSLTVAAVALGGYVYLRRPNAV
jgi:hypothetical protein